jgi:23S rRNA (uracil1939-C5)-methyltransferase
MINKNENYIVEITGQGHEGQGVAKIDGFTVFVEGALPGEKVEIKIVKVASSHGFGKLLKVLEPSNSRVKPFCSVYPRCGGCHVQHMSYESQLDFKTNVVKEALRRIGGFDDIKVNPCIGMKIPMNYRNKGQYPIGQAGVEVVMGFYANRSHEIISAASCEIQHGKSFAIANAVKDFMQEKKVSIYDEKTGKGLLRHVVTRIGFATGESMAVIVANADSLPFKDELIETLKSKFPDITSVVLNVNKKNTNVILGEKNITLYGKDYITDKIGNFVFKISPLSFFQVNPVQTEVLYSKALEYAQLTGDETVFDLYCGAGTISLFVAKKAKKVYGVEVVDAAIKDAKENAKLNGVGNVEFICGEAERVVPEMNVKADVVILDPPRKGCEKELLDTVVKMGAKRVVYVSCNPATLARDLKVLAEGGYALVEAQPVDMFPWTYHVETVCLLSRNTKG